MKGRVKWWSEEQGYGFIEYNDNQNVFAHVESVDKNNYKIIEDQEIEFILEEKADGLFLKLLNPIEN
ncbi:MAG: cold shock domain-containing protein [Firmicutes bacterium]|jgi:CspA family cold shock protein|nr:cold shock domain-containing protein [Bacillota bacterium]